MMVAELARTMTAYSHMVDRVGRKEPEKESSKSKSPSATPLDFHFCSPGDAGVRRLMGLTGDFTSISLVKFCKPGSPRHQLAECVARWRGHGTQRVSGPGLLLHLRAAAPARPLWALWLNSELIPSLGGWELVAWQTL
jgi:hypothetical protein